MALGTAYPMEHPSAQQMRFVSMAMLKMLFIIAMLTIWDLWVYPLPKVSVMIALITIIIIMASMMIGAQEVSELMKMIVSKHSTVHDMDKVVKQNYELTQIIHRTSEEHKLLCEIRNSLAAIRKISNESLYILRKTQDRDARKKYSAGSASGSSSLSSSSRSGSSSLKSTPSPQTHAEKSIFHIPSCNEVGKHADVVESKAIVTTSSTSKCFADKSHARQTILGSQLSASFSCLEGALNRHFSTTENEDGIMHIPEEISLLRDSIGQSHSFHTLSLLRKDLQ